MQNGYTITSTVSSHMFGINSHTFTSNPATGQRTVSDFYTIPTTANYNIRAPLPPPPGFAPIPKNAPFNTPSIYGNYFDIAQSYLNVPATSSFSFNEYAEDAEDTEDTEDKDMFPTFPSLSLKAVQEVQDEVSSEISPFNVNTETDLDINEPNRKNYDNTYDWLYAESDELCDPFGEFETYQGFSEYISDNSAIMLDTNGH